MSERKQKKAKNISTGTKMQQVTAGTPIRMEKAKSDRKPKPSVVGTVTQDFHPVGGFAKFIRDYGVIGVAVGFAIASQAQLLIKSMIDNIINPLYALLFNTGDPSKQVIVLHFRDRLAVINWGAFLTQFMNFLFVLAAIYAIVKILALDKLDDKDKKKK